MKEKSVSILVPVDIWKKYCADAEALGFSGEEFLLLSVLCDAECTLNVQGFEEMNRIPGWALKRLRSGLAEFYSGSGRIEKSA